MTITIIVRKFQTKTGKEFVVGKIGGKYLPDDLKEKVGLLLLPNYTVRSCGVALPTKEGIYTVEYPEKGLWIDNRVEVADKGIIRIRATKFEFKKDLPIFDKPKEPKVD